MKKNILILILSMIMMIGIVSALTSTEIIDLVNENTNSTALYYVDFNNTATDIVSGLVPQSVISISYAEERNKSYALFRDLTSRVLLGENESFYQNMSDSNGVTVFLDVRFNTTIQSTLRSIFSRYDSTTNNRQFLFGHQDNFRVSHSSTGFSTPATVFDQVIFDSDVDTTEWYTVALTIDKNNVSKHYLNNELVSIGSVGFFDIPTGLALSVGAHNQFDSAMMDVAHVSVWDGALDSDGVNRLYSYINNEEYVPKVDDILETDKVVVVQDLDIYYDIYSKGYTTGKRPLVLISNSYSNARSKYTDDAAFMKDLGYFTVNMDARGSGDSDGVRDFYAEDCRDVYSVLESVIEEYEYIIDPERIYFYGLSEGGGRVTACTGRMPDLITAGVAISPLANLTMRVELDTVTTLHTDIPAKLGGQYSEVPEQYDSRNAAYTYVNTNAPIKLIQGAIDTLYGRPQITLSFYQKVSPYLTADFHEEPGLGHEMSEGTHILADEWFSLYNKKIVLPRIGSYNIGTFIKTELFDIDLGKGSAGTVSFDFSNLNRKFEMTVNTETYEGQVNVTAKDVLRSDMVLTDNGVSFATIVDGNLELSNSSYNVVISDKDIYFTLPHMSEHTIIGLVSSSDHNSIQTCRSIEDTVFNAMNLGIVAIIVLIASVLIGAVMAFGGANFDVGTITATVLTVILVAIMFLIGTVVVATIGGTIC